MSGTLLLEEPPLVVQAGLAQAVGLEEALFLQQLHYWLRRSKHQRAGVPWVYNSYAEWQAQLPWMSVPAVRRVIAGLEKRGLLRTGEFNTSPLDRTKWYTLDYAALAACVAAARSVENDTWSADFDSPGAENDLCSRSDSTGGSDESDQLIPETTDQETTQATTATTATTPPPALPSPPSPPPPNVETPDDDAGALVTHAQALFRDLFPGQANRAVLARIADDVRGARARGHPLTRRGLEYSLHQAGEGTPTPWRYARSIWQAKPDGPGEGDSDDRHNGRTAGPAQHLGAHPGGRSAAGRPARPAADPAAEERATAALLQFTGGAPPQPGRAAG